MAQFKVTLQNSNSFSESRLADTTNKKKKPHRPCPFCYKLQSALSRHIQKCHKEEEEVKAAMSLPGPERRKAFTNLKRKGIYHHNAELLKSGELTNQSVEELILERNIGSCPSHSVMAMCSLCKVFIRKKNMHRHKRFCKAAETTTTPPCGISLTVLKEVQYPEKYIHFFRIISNR